MGVKLFVGNLSYSTTEQELKDAFSQTGSTVNSVRIAIDRATQRPRGFAFVELATDADADTVIKAWSGQMLGGRNLFVEKAQERVPGAPRPAPRSRPGGGPGDASGRPQGGVFGGNRPGGGTGAPGGFRPRPRFPIATAEVNKEEQRRRQTRPEKRGEKKKTDGGGGRPEERERGKWRWDGSDDY